MKAMNALKYLKKLSYIVVRNTADVHDSTVEVTGIASMNQRH